jgi:hypothetical protein
MSLPPAKLYKYMPPERAASVLGKLLIRFSQVSVMNDIEEFKPPIHGLATDETFQQKFRERADALYPGLMALVEAQGPEYMKKVHEQAEKNLSQTIKKIYDINDKNFGILSLSENPSSKFMWDKYTAEGRGFCVEFDSSHQWFNQKKAEDDDLRHLRRISYVDDRTPAYLFALEAEDYLYTKEKKWEYESEWRLILNFNGAASNVGKDHTETDVLLFAIPPDCLLSVTVGYDASPEFIAEVKTALAEKALSHVKLKYAKQKEDSSVDIEEEPPGSTPSEEGPCEQSPPKTSDQSQPNLELYGEHKKQAIENINSSTDSFDQNLLTLSSAALGVSLAFIKDIVPLDKAIWLWLLFTSWICFTGCILATLASFQVSIAAQKEFLKCLGRYYIDRAPEYLDKHLESRSAKLLTGLTWLAAAFFLVGLVSTLIFCVGNVSRRSAMGDSKSAPLREGRQPGSMTPIPDSGSEQRGRQPATMTPTPQPQPPAPQPAPAKTDVGKKP